MIITFTGRLGNLIGYRRKGHYFLRSMPEVVRQTAATRRAAQRFGVASKRSALIRHAIIPELDITCAGDHVNRLNSTLLRAGIHHIQAIAGFRFNQQTGTGHFFTVAPTLSGEHTLHIPPQNLQGRKGMTALAIKVIAVRLDFINRQIISTDAATLIQDLRVPFHGATIPIDAPGKGVLIVTLQVMGMQGESVSDNIQYHTADIIAVRVPVTETVVHSTIYPASSTFTVTSAFICSTVHQPPALFIIQRE